MQRVTVILGVMLVIVVAAGEVHAKKEGAHGKTHWGYSGRSGPQYWGDLSATFRMCKEGKEQSPIDISDATNVLTLKTKYVPTPIVISNNGHAIQVDNSSKSTLTAGRNEYQLLQFHFHSPSEHTLNGRLLDLEVHLVHRDYHGRLAVIGIFLKRGAHNKSLDVIFNNLPRTAAEREVIEGLFFDPRVLLPKNPNFYNYRGSLTTPPCSEGVNWFVFRTPIEVSAEQISKFKRVYSGNNRPVQPLHGRSVTLH